MILGLLRRLRILPAVHLHTPLRQPVYMNRMTVVAGHFVFIDYIEQRATLGKKCHPGCRIQGKMRNCLFLCDYLR